MDVAIIEVPNEVVDQFWFLIDMIIYKSLEDGGCIHEAECHDIELEGAFGGVECGEPFLAFFDA